MSEFDPESLDIPPGSQRGRTEVEEAADRVTALLPDATISRTRDVIQFDSGGEAGVVVVVTPEALEIRLPVTEWTRGTHGPALSSRLWKRIEHRHISDAVLTEYLRDALLARQAQYSTCRFCGEQFPPDKVIDTGGTVCHGCASSELGVVF
jgi:hypothetical protein